MASAAIAFASGHPDLYLANVQRTAGQLFKPRTQWPPVRTPRAAIGAYADWLDGALHGDFGFGRWNVWALFAALTIIIGAAFGLLAAWSRQRATPTGVLLFTAGTCVYLALVAVRCSTPARQCDCRRSLMSSCWPKRFLRCACGVACGVGAFAKQATLLRSADRWSRNPPCRDLLPS